VVATVGGRQILTTEDGFTLYVFANDPVDTGTSSCFASCAQAWPPFLIVGAPTGGADIAPGLGTITREDGNTQVSYKGKPLYRFANDEQQGDTKGDGAGGVWSVAIP
jgi:predicted lipoprotein with Yx(FWY)xxD motif